LKIVWLLSSGGFERRGVNEEIDAPVAGKERRALDSAAGDFVREQE
jgi:hypothetical protein